MNTSLAYKEEYLKEELINGQVVLMSPKTSISHVKIIDNISTIFNIFLKGKTCQSFPDGVAVFLTEKDYFVPDFMVVCDPEKIKNDGIHGAPDLVVEVLSPSTAKRDRTYKKQVYEQCGVREYWLVSPNEKSVEQYLLDNDQLVLHNVYAIYPDFQLARMTEEERAEASNCQFKCSLYDDLLINLDDIFDRVK